jgi:hypothetical protein
MHVSLRYRCLGVVFYFRPPERAQHMPKSTPQTAQPQVSQEVFAELYLQFRIPQRRRQALDEFLTDEEVSLIAEGQDPTQPGLEYSISGKRILDVLVDLRGWSYKRALLELAFGLEMIRRGQFQSLRKAIGEPIESDVSPPRRASDIRARWVRAEGKLWFGGLIIRKLRILATASNLERILASFEDNSWSTSIAEPFNGNLGQADLHSTINQLNRGL